MKDKLLIASAGLLVAIMLLNYSIDAHSRAAAGRATVPKSQPKQYSV